MVTDGTVRSSNNSSRSQGRWSLVAAGRQRGPVGNDGHNRLIQLRTKVLVMDIYSSDGERRRPHRWIWTREKASAVNMRGNRLTTIRNCRRCVGSAAKASPP